MRGSKLKKVNWLWIGAFFNFLFILGFVPFARFLENILKKLLGSYFPFIFSGLFTIIFIILFYRFIWYPSEKRYYRIILFLIFLCIFFAKFKSLSVPVERFHLFEYGLLAALVLLGYHSKDLKISYLGWSLSIVWLVGIIDETFQWVWPNRVGEWRDVIINIESGLFGLAFCIILLIGRKSFNFHLQRNLFYNFTSFCFLTIISCSFFFLVQEFGVKNYDENIGYFNSYFTKDDLLSITPYIYQLMETNRQEKVVWKRFRFYNYEGQEHLNRIKLLIDQNKYSEALSEYLLFSKYFKTYSQVVSSISEKDIKILLSTNKPLEPLSFKSTVMDWLIVSLTYHQVLYLFSIFEIIFLAAGILVWRKEN